jgi:hypothetical protein
MRACGLCRSGGLSRWRPAILTMQLPLAMTMIRYRLSTFDEFPAHSVMFECFFNCYRAIINLFGIYSGKLKMYFVTAIFTLIYSMACQITEFDFLIFLICVDYPMIVQKSKNPAHGRNPFEHCGWEIIYGMSYIGLWKQQHASFTRLPVGLAETPGTW